MTGAAETAFAEVLAHLRKPRPASHFVDVELWATTNNIGINAVYEYMRREKDPLPHIRQGRRHLVDDELAVAWFRRNFGVNTGEAA